MDAASAERGGETSLMPGVAVGQNTLGFALMQAGDTGRAIAMADKARRLSPYDPMSFAMIGVLGFSLALDGRHDEAVETLAMAIRQPNAHSHLVALAAVCDALAGREADARRTLGRLHAAAPEYGEREFRRAFQFQQPAHAQLIGDAFLRLGRLRPAGRGIRARRSFTPQAGRASARPLPGLWGRGHRVCRDGLSL